MGGRSEKTRQRDRERYLEDPDKRLAQIEQARDWQRANRDRSNEIKRQWRLRHWRKYLAQCAVKNAIASGRLLQRPCETCGVGEAEAHHDNYRKPLEVRWLCNRHHKEHHRLQRAAARLKEKSDGRGHPDSDSEGTRDQHCQRDGQDGVRSE